MSDYLLFMRNLMAHLNQAMKDEKIDSDVRQRVVNRLMLGEPSPENPRVHVDHDGPNPGLSGPGW